MQRRNKEIIQNAHYQMQNSNSNPNRNSINNKFKKTLPKKRSQRKLLKPFMFFFFELIKYLGYKGCGWVEGWWGRGTRGSREVGGKGQAYGICCLLAELLYSLSLSLSVLILYCTYCTYAMHSGAKHPAILLSLLICFFF